MYPIIKPVSFQKFEKEEVENHQSEQINIIQNVPLEITVELGKTQKTIAEILDLHRGSIIELDKIAGEPADILVGGKLVAKGEVVIIDENFGIKITEITKKYYI